MLLDYNIVEWKEVREGEQIQDRMKQIPGDSTREVYASVRTRRED